MKEPDDDAEREQRGRDRAAAWQKFREKVAQAQDPAPKGRGVYRRVPHDPNRWVTRDDWLCGARTRAGLSCRMTALFDNGRCKWHGGCSTGPKTEAGKWARENGNTGLDNAMRDAYGLAVTCWTEIDEGLMQLSQAARQIERGNPTEAVESIGWAIKYMNRWQDRDGAIGNAECVTGLTLEDGRAVPASFASAKIDRLDDLERAVKGLTLVKSVFGLDAKLIIKHHVLNTEALREVWPQLLDRLLAPCPGAIPPKPFDWKASGLLGE